MLKPHYNDEKLVRVRCHVVYKRIRIWICRIGPHKFSVPSQVRLWKLGVDRFIHITHLGAFLHNPETPAYRTFQVSRSKRIDTIAFAKYSSKSVKICALVTDRWHKLETCSTVTPTTENTENSTGFTQCIRLSKSYQRSLRILTLAHACVSLCFFPLFCHPSHGDNNSGQEVLCCAPEVPGSWHLTSTNQGRNRWHIFPLTNEHRGP